MKFGFFEVDSELARLTISITMRESKIVTGGPASIFDNERIAYLI